MAEVVMPRLSDSMEEGTIIQWLKGDGDEVSRGDEIVEIETDKATMTYEADQDGVLNIVAQEGETLPIGAVIARIGGEGAETGDRRPETGEAPAAAEAAAGNGAPDVPAAPVATAPPPEPSEPAPPPASAAPSAPAPATPPPANAGDGRVKASPIARRMAQERGLDLRSLTGSGPGGRIVKADVEAAGAGAPAASAPQPAAAPAPGQIPEPATAKGEAEVIALTKTQQVIARRMAESKATVPEFTLTTEVDMEEAVRGRAQLKQVAGEDGVVPSFNDMVVKACALALREFPRVNGAYRDGHFELYSNINVGVAVAAEDALIVPTVFNADARPLGDIAREARRLAARVREGTITPPELSGGTFTVSNLGMFGVTEFVAVINPPQAAIMSVGAMEPKAVVRDGEIVARHMMAVTLACDHRILYGADAAQFLARVRALLQSPLSLAL